MTFRPSLACNADWSDYERIFSQLDVPYLYASPKLDGIRAINIGGQLVSRTLKLIRNRYIQSILGIPELNGLDGELVVGQPYGEGVFARTSSGVMSEHGEPDFKYYVFDNWQKEGKFEERLTWLDSQNFSTSLHSIIQVLPQVKVRDLKKLEEVESMMTETGYEGVILRHPASPYKQGRSTLRERYMLKLKRFSDGEAKIIGFQELMHNANEATLDPRGYTVHSSHKDNKIGMDTLGALQVEDLQNPNWVFNVGTGFDQSLRDHIWNNQEGWLNKTIKYKFLAVGTLELPRHPVYLGLRDLEDL